MQKLRRHVETRKVEKAVLEETAAKAERQAQEEEKRAEWMSQVRAFFEYVAEEARKDACEAAENMVTQALSSVITDRDVAFKVQLGTSRKRPDARFKVFTRDANGERTTDPLSGNGGGIADVLSLALRILLLESAQPAIGGPLFLDEPGKHVAPVYAPHVAEFLRTVCREFGRQVILITHSDDLAQIGDKSYDVRLVDGISVVTELSNT